MLSLLKFIYLFLFLKKFRISCCVISLCPWSTSLLTGGKNHCFLAGLAREPFLVAASCRSVSEENCRSKCKLNRRRKKFQCGRSKAGRHEFENDYEFEDEKIQVDPES